tara:strand:- start:565 stop:1011 length:447 start_codon:yes stop_codon:yes gene_type:complete
MKAQRGFSLIELVIAIVIISVAVGGVMLVFVVALTHSADPQRQQQAVAIAEAYLDEILTRAYDDPDGSNVGETRATFDNVGDYNGINQVPTDQDGAAIAGLADYTVQVSVVDSNALGPAGNTITARRIDVRVTSLPLVDTTISAYKAQ